jgi:hypothetical protein
LVPGWRKEPGFRVNILSNCWFPKKRPREEEAADTRVFVA